MTLPAPYPPLVSGGDGLERYPAEPTALATRMAALYGVDAGQVLPTRGLTHGLELIWRLAARDGLKVQAPDAEPYTQLAALYARLAEDADTAAVVIRALGSSEAVAEMAERVAPALLVVDEGLVEFAEAPSAAAVVKDHANLIVLRSLSLAYGLAGARVGAAVAQAQTLARLAGVLEPYALPEISVRLAMQALDPSRMMETAERISAVRRERARVAEALSRIMALEPGSGR
jgi:histidinol-phosphate/aromatic aminotransferase/cobyric acid decarboxylase-like protein